MTKIKAKPLTRDNFAEYGNFYDIMKPEGHNLGTFYHDHVLFPVSGESPVGFSALVAKKRDMVVTKSEYHNYTGEVSIPLDGDVILYVAPPSKEPIPEQTEAFYVPKGTVVCINTGVWHMGPFPVDKEEVHLMIALPERTYMKDCIVVEYAPEDYVEISL